MQQKYRPTTIAFLEHVLKGLSSLAVLLYIFVQNRFTRVFFAILFLSILGCYFLARRTRRSDLSTLSILTVSVVIVANLLLAFGEQYLSLTDSLILLPAVLALGVYVFSFRYTRGRPLDG